MSGRSGNTTMFDYVKRISHHFSSSQSGQKGTDKILLVGVELSPSLVVGINCVGSCACEGLSTWKNELLRVVCRMKFHHMIHNRS